MIEYLASNADVLAVKVTGKLLHDQLEEVADKVEAALEANEKTHIFVEVADFHGFDLSALPDYLPRAAKMLGKLDRFGRIAVVSDLAWVRWATRIESALLPGISYEVFTSEARDRALAWVEGRIELPHPPALKLIETDKPEVLGFELDGRIGAEEMHKIAARIHQLLDERPGPVRMLGRFKHFRFPAPGGIDADYVRMKLRALERVERYAVVGGPLMLTAWVAAIAPLLRLEVRHFPADREHEAWQWLGAVPKVEEALAA